MSVLHSALATTECHEPKNFSTAVVGDSGKVNTPSSASAGTSVLRNLRRAEAPVSTGTGVITAGQVALTVDVYDQVITSLTGDVKFLNPTGLLFQGQELTLIIQQDATGGRSVTWDTAFLFATTVPTINNGANEVTILSFVGYGAFWIPKANPNQTAAAYSGKTITNNATTTATTAAADATFQTAADYDKVTAIWDSPDVAPSKNMVRTADSITVPVKGVYEISAHINAKHDTISTLVAFNPIIEGTQGVDRPLIINCKATGERNHGAAHGIYALDADDTIELGMACTKTGNVTIVDARISVNLIERTQ